VRRPHLIISVIATIVGGMMAAPEVFAHKMLISCDGRGERLRVEAFFDDDTPAQNAKVIVENEAREIVLEGKTDDRGVWSVPKPAPGKYLVRAETFGHVAREALVVAAETSAPKVIAPPEMSPKGAEASVAMPRESVQPDSHPARDQATGTPWLKVAIGLAIIAGICALLRSARKGVPENGP